MSGDRKANGPLAFTPLCLSDLRLSSSRDFDVAVKRGRSVYWISWGYKPDKDQEWPKQVRAGAHFSFVWAVCRATQGMWSNVKHTKLFQSGTAK